MKNKSRLHTLRGVQSGLLCRVDCMALNLSPRLFFIFFLPQLAHACHELAEDVEL